MSDAATPESGYRCLDFRESRPEWGEIAFDLIRHVVYYGAIFAAIAGLARFN